MRGGKSALRSVCPLSLPCAHPHAAIACLVSDNRWLDIIKLISVIKEVPLPKLGHAGILLAGDRKQRFVLYASLPHGDNFIQILSCVLIISAIIMRARVYVECDLEMLIKGSAEQ